MALNLYLDDCSNSDLLDELLRQEGHLVVRPTHEDVNMAGEDDEDHFAFAVAHGLTIITKNPADYEAIHLADPGHPGIFGVYQDNDPRDMLDSDIVRAIRNIEEVARQGSLQIRGQFFRLNEWRY